MPIDLHAAANNLGVVAPDLKAGSGKALEAQVMFALALALKAHFSVRARSNSGHLLGGAFGLRGAPGHVADPTAPIGPSYFSVEIDTHFIFELHNSLEFRGMCGEHEVDVSAVFAQLASQARHSTPRIMRGPPLLGIELKEYTGDVDKNLVRAFLACIIDFVPMWPIRHFKIGREPQDMASYSFPDPPRDQFWFLTTGSLSAPTKAFASGYAIRSIDLLDQGKLAKAARGMAAHLRANSPVQVQPQAVGVTI